ncbi:phage terminase small subunit P27 family [Devosia rhodophyticola]|uniref:Phage terminase small subunit P27 family n=1 Tax=Devosia rhodophyticola TaxID=3026423 RepID=A0ABY7YW82_9HYPH|nr:phage terminase small subunit P27 family [Devosia rhodophyticola]WDR05628.1 phage terminase small subunit P27 family [Devosia rhodophyticola]
MRGRNPASIVAGTSPVTKVPPAPSYLSKDGKAEWRKVAPILITERKTLTHADLATLENYCNAVAIMREARRVLNAEGLITSTGKRHPAFGIMNAAQTTQRLCAAELGLTPVSRSRPAVRNDDRDHDNPFGI